MRYFLDGLSFYKRNFMAILVLALTTTLPLLLLSDFLSTFMVAYNLALGVPLFSRIPQFIISITFMFVIEIPFIFLANRWMNQERYSYGEVYSSFFENLFPVYVIGAITAFLIAFGSLLFIIPGIILMVLFMTIPYVAVIEKDRWFVGWKRAFSIGKEKFFPILGVSVLLTIVTLIINLIFQFIAVEVTGTLLIYSFAQILFNMLFVPYVAAVTTFYFRDWAGISNKWQW
jgi:hypothetical protein